MSFLDKSVAGAAPDGAADTADLREVWLTLRRRRRAIAAMTATVMAVALLLVLRAQPQFTAAGSLYTGGLHAAGGDAAAGTSYIDYLATFRAVTDSETQVDLLSSPLLIQRAVLATGLNATIQGGKTPMSYWRWKLFHNGNVGAYAPHGDALEALYASFTDPAVAAASYQIRFATGGAFELRRRGALILRGRLGQPAAGGGVSLLLRTVDPADQPAPGSRYTIAIADPVIVAQSIRAGHLTIAPGGTTTTPSDIMNIGLTWNDPYQATAFVNQLMADYISAALGWNAAAAGGMAGFITQQLTDVRAQLATANARLADYQRQTGIISPPDDARDAVTLESQQETQRAQLEVQVAALRQIADAMRQPGGRIEPYLVSGSADSALPVLAEKLAEEAAAASAMAVQYTSAAPEMQQEAAKLQQLRNAIHALVQNDLSHAQSQLNATNRLLAQFQDKIKTMPAQLLQVAALTRASETLGQLYVLLMQKEQEAALSKAAALSPTQVLTPAQLPLHPVSPKPAVVLGFALVAGLFASAALVLARRALSGWAEADAAPRHLSPYARGERAAPRTGPRTTPV